VIFDFLNSDRFHKLLDIDEVTTARSYTERFLQPQPSRSSHLKPADAALPHHVRAKQPSLEVTKSTKQIATKRKRKKSAFENLPGELRNIMYESHTGVARSRQVCIYWVVEALLVAIYLTEKKDVYIHIRTYLAA
jgi:hypothetical protein